MNRRYNAAIGATNIAAAGSSMIAASTFRFAARFVQHSRPLDKAGIGRRNRKLYEAVTRRLWSDRARDTTMLAQAAEGELSATLAFVPLKRCP